MRATLDAGCCLLRPWRKEDAAALAHEANNLRVARNLTHLFPHPYTLADARFWIDHCLSGAEPLAWAIEAEGTLRGGLGVHRREGVFAHSAEIGYWLGEAHWGRGYASAAVAAACRHCFTDTDLLRLEAGVFAWNPASMRVLEKNGFGREGCQRLGISKAGELTDRILYGRLRTDPAPL
ncbi:MAG: GNAT family N-acetyltransferase [Uliginosibacterium sp.]|nr:GNAT family N-acetyltransferase [Uliginosibacterium sp.]